MSEPFVDLITDLEPHLNSDAKRGYKAFQSIVNLFPGKPLPEVEKKIRTLVEQSENAVDSLADRAKSFCRNGSEESLESLLKPIKKLPAPDLVELRQLLGFELAGKKTQDVKAVQRWLETRGREVPVSPKALARIEAAKYLEGLESHLSNITSANADLIIQRAQAAYKALKLPAFKEFCNQLGVSVFGSKAKMLQQVKNHFNGLAVSHVQTQF